MENLKLETVNLNHAKFLNYLMNDSMIKTALHEIETNLDDWKNAIYDWQNDLDEEGYIITDNNKPIGWVAINGLLSTDYNVYLKMLVLEPSYHNKGIGMFVLNAIIKDLKDRKYKSILLYTDKTNVKAQKCYKKCGFKIIESMIEQMSDQSYVERYLMKIDLIEGRNNMWFDKNDKTRPVITAKEQVESSHGKRDNFVLPKTAVLLYMSGLEFINERYEVELVTERFPRFLDACPVYKIKGQNDICFLDGGRGAPQAADTIETLKALGIEKVVSVGMIGGYSKSINVGDIIIPPLVYSEEGTSLHYYENEEFYKPDNNLYKAAVDFVENCKQYPIVSTDAVFRQTFKKESLWRDKGAVGVDMETSAVLSVGEYLGLKVVAMLMVSDVHPLDENDDKWSWKMTKEMRKEVIYKAIDFALSI